MVGDLDRTTGDQTLDEHEDGVVDEDAGLARGRSIGRYVALRRLGKGGMGVVWSAWDPELDREVAIKLLSRRFTGETARGRLLREAQALARVDHPNIVAVHDVGLFEGRVFIAMEQVRGQTLRAWLEESERAWPEIVEVYRQAARGLGAAHQAGLVHRDFKPDNAMIDASGRVRVMDFGLAAAHGAGDEEGRGRDPIPADMAIERSTSDLLSTPLTEVGAVIGTPAYMAPEQFDGGRGGPAADQFALCVALWQALFGERPFAGDTVHELIAAVSLGRLRAPANKFKVPAEIRKALERGLRVEPMARWPSLAALDEALEIEEREHSRWWLVGAGALVSVVLGVGFWSQDRRAEACHDVAAQVRRAWDSTRRVAVATALRNAGPHGEGVWTRAEPALEQWVDEWTRVSAGACLEDDGLPDSLRVAQAVCLDRRRRSFEATLALLEQPDAELAARAVDMVADLPSPAACADAEALAALDRRPPPSDPEAAKRLRERLAEGRALIEGGRYRAAKQLLIDERDVSESLGDRALHGELLQQLGWAEYELGELEVGVETLTDAYAALLGAGEDELAAAVAVDLILVNARLVKPDQARGWDVHAQALINRVDADAVVRGDRLIALGVAADAAGEYRAALDSYEAAAKLLEDAFGPDSLRLARMLDELGAVHSRLGELDAALAVQERSLALIERGLGPAHPEVGTAHFNLGNTFYRNGDLAGARAHFERAIAIVEPALGASNGTVTGSLNGLGAVALGEGNDGEAAAKFRAALVGIEARVGPDHPDLVPPLVNLGIALKRAGDYPAAEAAQLRALGLLEAQLGPEHPDLLAVLDNLGELRSLAHDYSGAVEAYSRSLAIGERSFGVGHPELDYALVGLGEAALELGDLERAGRSFDRVLADTQVEGKNVGLVAVAHFGLARILAARGHESEATAHAEQARSLVAAQPRPDPGDLARIDAWLGEHGVEPGCCGG